MGVRTIALNVLEWHRWCMKHMLVAERSLSLSLSLSLLTELLLDVFLQITWS